MTQLSIDELFCVLLFRESLDSPSLLCCAVRLTEELRRWLHALEAYHAHMHSMNSERSGLLCAPLPLLPPLSSYVGHLATLCAEMDVYSSAHDNNNHTFQREATPIHQACDTVTPTSESHDSPAHITLSHDSTIPTSKSCGMTTPTSQSCDSLDAYINRYFDYLDVARLFHLLSQQNWDIRRNCWKVLAAKLAASHTSFMVGDHSRSVSGLSEEELLSALLR